MSERATVPVTIADARERGAAKAIVWTLLDIALIILFAASGRRTHEHGVTVAGVLETAWPFLLAYVLMACVTRAWRSPGRLLPTALLLWVGTVVAGLLLRALSGAGVALSFQIVTLLVLGAFILLPRTVAHLVERRRGREPVA